MRENLGLDKENIKRRLKELLLENREPIGIILKGEWGIGKTYLWKEIEREFAKEDKNKKFIYISLFGESSVDELKENILLQISKSHKLLKFLKNILDGIALESIPGVPLKINPSSLLSLIPQELSNTDGANFIFCFDEFERLSKGLTLEEVLGIISYLKEHLESKVVVILNEEFLKERKKEIYTLYKEKIIDYELLYRPTVEKNFELVKDNLKWNDFEEDLLKFLKKFEIRNIRLIKQLIFRINDFKFIDNLEVEDILKREFFIQLIRFTYIKISEDFDNFDEVKNYYQSNLFSFSKKDKQKNETFERYLKILPKSYYDPFQPNYHGAFSFPIIGYLKAGNLNEVKETIEEAKKLLRNKEKFEMFVNYFKKFRYDFNYKLDKFNEEVKEFLDKEHEILEIMSIDALIELLAWLFEKNKEYGKDKNYNGFYKEYIKKVIKIFVDKHLERLIEEPNYFNIRIASKFAKFVKAEFEKYVAKKKEEIFEREIRKEEILATIERIMSESGWYRKEKELLVRIPKEKYKDFMLEDPKFTELIVEFCRWSNNLASPPFPEVLKIIKEVMEDLEKQKKYKYKIRELKRIIGWEQ